MNRIKKIRQLWKKWAIKLKREVLAIYLSYGDPRVTWYAKALIFIVAAYALSPIDLIPDFIPIIGYLDDMILLPLGIMLAIRMIPEDVLTESRKRAELMADKPVSCGAAIIVILIWISAALFLIKLVFEEKRIWIFFQ